MSPYATCTPACSSARAHLMLACSSNRALISTSATTCLPAAAASMSALTIGESPDVRYSVCLMASTLGSAAACSTHLTVQRVTDAGLGFRTAPQGARDCPAAGDGQDDVRVRR